MRFYKCSRMFVCGVDLHCQSLYVCIMDREQNILVHRNVRSQNTDYLLKLLDPFRHDLVVAAESGFTWYWLADFCAQHGIEFQLGHALYMKAIHGAKSKNDRIDSEKIAKLTMAGMLPMAYVYPKKNRALRDLLRRRFHFARLCSGHAVHTRTVNSQYNLDPIGAINTAKIRENLIPPRFEDPCSRRSVALDIETIAFLDAMVGKVEKEIDASVWKENPREMEILQSIRGIGPILSQTILLEAGTIDRFSSHQQFASYCRLVKCAHESGGKKLGCGGAKIGNPYLKFAFTEAAIMAARYNPNIGKYLERMEKKHGKGKAKIILAHKIARAVYYMLKNGTAFDEQRFLSH